MRQRGIVLAILFVVSAGIIAWTWASPLDAEIKGSPDGKNVTYYWTSWALPGTGENYDPITGHQAWVNPNGITGTGEATLEDFGPNTVSKYLVGVDFGFSIPSNATIEGVELQVWFDDSAHGTGSDPTEKTVKLYNNRSFLGDNQADGTALPDQRIAALTYGDEDDTWGATLTPAIVNASTFGAAFQCETDGSASSDCSVDIDYFYMRIRYSTP